MRDTVAVLGPLLGTHTGFVISQGEVLADHLRADGIDVLTASHVRNRWLRLADTIYRVWTWRTRPSAVVLMVFGGPGFVVADITSLAVSRWTRARLVLHLHGGTFNALSQRHPRWATRVLNRADVIVAPSEYQAERVREMGLPVEIVPNALPRAAAAMSAATGDRFSSTGPLRVLWMRTFHHNYFPEMALHVVHELVQRGVDVRLTMAGQDDGLLEPTMDRARELGVDGRVAFVGFLGPDEKATAFATHDLYLHTNRIDNMPVSVLEASAAGLTVVATDVGGMRRLIDDERTGLIVPPGDVVAMADAVERLRSDPVFARQLAAAGAERAQASSWGTLRDQWRPILRLGASGDP